MQRFPSGLSHGLTYHRQPWSKPTYVCEKAGWTLPTSEPSQCSSNFLNRRIQISHRPAQSQHAATTSSMSVVNHPQITRTRIKNKNKNKKHDFFSTEYCSCVVVFLTLRFSSIISNKSPFSGLRQVPDFVTNLSRLGAGRGLL